MPDKKNENGTTEAVAEEVAAEESSAKGKSSEKVNEVVDSASKSLNEAVKQVEKQVGNISKALSNALQDRANVVMVRVNDDSLQYLDMLVEADITKSRSESAAFLINEGIKANETLFNKIRQITDQISELKSQLRETVKVDEA